MVKHNTVTSKIPKGFRKLPSGGQNRVGYTAYAKGSKFNPNRYGKYVRVYVKKK